MQKQQPNRKVLLFLAALAVLASGVASAMVVRRRIDRLDMVAALKTRE